MAEYPHVELFEKYELRTAGQVEPIAVKFYPMYPCDVRVRRSYMTDEEFWADVFSQGGLVTHEPDFDCVGIDSPTPCPECGSTVACGYDSEGRPMIHVVQEDDDGT